MDNLALVALVFALFASICAAVAVAHINYDLKLRTLALKRVEKLELKLTETVKLLGDTHNTITKGQLSLANRIEVLENRTSALASSIATAQGRRM